MTRSRRSSRRAADPRPTQGRQAPSLFWIAVWSALVACGVAALLAGRNGLLWGHGLPIGHDFHIYYAAARAASDGRLAEIFVPEQLWPLAQAYVGTAFATNGLWLYPPHYLLLLAPLALLPYVAAYVTFAVATLAAYLAAARGLGLDGRRLVLLALAPTTLFTVLAGQNGLLTGALLALGVAFALDRPALAGVLIGVLTIKPHLGLLVVVALVALRAWRAMLVATLTALGLAVIATAVYGVDAWTGPFDYTLPALTRGVTTVAEYWATGFTSVFAHTAMLLGPGTVAWILQAATAALACVATWRVCRRSTDTADRLAVVGIGTLLTFPYLFFYDLPIATLAAAVYAQAKPWLLRADRALLVALAFVPVLVISGIPLLAPAVIVAAFLRVWWRAEHPPEPGSITIAADRPSREAAASWSPQLNPAIALLVLVTVVVYANSLAGPFILDDDVAIVSNASIRSPGDALGAPRNTPLAGRPVAALTFALNFAAGGLDVVGYHLVNLAVHAICALLLAGIVGRTLTLPALGHLRPHARSIALTVALIWAVHPLNSEAVNYVTQRTESLMALFYLLTLYASIRGVSSPHAPQWTVCASVACVLGMGCKETMATAPLAVALYDRIYVFGAWRELRQRWPLYGGLAVGWLFLAYLLLDAPRAGSTGFATDVTPWTYVLNQAAIVTRYVRLAVWPVGLVVNYGPPTAVTVSDVWPQVLFVGSLIALTVVALIRRPHVGFLGAWFFMNLAPSSSIVPIATQVAAERRMYLPLMAVVTLLVVAARHVQWPATRAWRLAAVSLVVAGLGGATIARNREFASPLRLAETVLERWPTDVAHGMVGAELVRAERDHLALDHLRLGARTDPTARYNLGVALVNSRQYDEAIRELDRLVSTYPEREEVPWSRRLIGQAHAAQRRWPEAIAEFRAVLAMTPHDASAKRLLLDALMAQGVTAGLAGQHQAAAETFRQAVRLDPGDTRVRANLVGALIETGDVTAAVDEARGAVAANRADAIAHDLLGRALALQGHYAEAIASLEEAARLRPADPTIQDDLRRVQAASAGAFR